MKKECIDIAKSYLDELQEVIDSSDYDLFLDWANENILDYTFLVDASKEYIAAYIDVALGGPNVTFNTLKGIVTCSWGGDSESIYLPNDIKDYLDDYMSELYNN